MRCTALPVVLALILSFTAPSSGWASDATGPYLDFTTEVDYTEIHFSAGIAHVNKKPYTGISITSFEDKMPMALYSWNNGIRHGIYIEFSEDRERYTMGSYLNGNKHGGFITFRGSPGHIFQTGHYRNDKLHGELISFDADGNVKRKLEFIDDNLRP